MIELNTFRTVWVCSHVRFVWQGVRLVWRFLPWFLAAASVGFGSGRSVPFSGATVAGRFCVFDSRTRMFAPGGSFREASPGVLFGRFAVEGTVGPDAVELVYGTVKHAVLACPALSIRVLRATLRALLTLGQVKSAA